MGNQILINSLSVVTLTSIPDALHAWKKSNCSTWKGRGYTVLTFLYLTPGLGITLAILSRLIALVVSVCRRTPVPPPRMDREPPRQSSNGNVVILNTRKGPYFEWLDAVSALPVPPIVFYNNVNNIKFDSGVPTTEIDEKSLTEELEKRKITLENLGTPTDIPTLKSQMLQLGWSEEDLAFILPCLAPSARRRMVVDALPKIQEWNHGDSSGTEVSDLMLEGGHCYIPKKDSQVMMLERYYSIGIKGWPGGAWVAVGFRIDFQVKRQLLVECKWAHMVRKPAIVDAEMYE